MMSPPVSVLQGQTLGYTFSYCSYVTSIEISMQIYRKKCKKVLKDTVKTPCTRRSTITSESTQCSIPFERYRAGNDHENRELG